jgi:hypothetical protein
MPAVDFWTATYVGLACDTTPRRQTSEERKLALRKDMIDRSDCKIDYNRVEDFCEHRPNFLDIGLFPERVCFSLWSRMHRQSILGSPVLQLLS